MLTGRLRGLALVVVVALCAPLTAQKSQLGYYRQPAIWNDTLVFVAEGDLWRVGVAGGVAQRLTTHPEEESRPAISPDGKMVAYAATYEGPGEVYTLPLEGGVPTRQTWDATRPAWLSWTPKGEVLYATRRHSTLPNAQLVRLDPSTHARTIVALAQASDGSFDAAGATLFFTRLAFQGSHTRRYKGGTAQNLWRFDGAGTEAAALTADYAGTSKTPMLWKGRVYFASDRDGVMNLWSMNERGGDLKQHTKHRDFEVQSPSLSNGRIAYQQGADIRVFDIASGSDRAVPITLMSDFDQLRERWVKNAVDWITSAHISPSGDRVAITARGQVFVAPALQGRLVEATRNKLARHRNARFMPDGKIDPDALRRERRGGVLAGPRQWHRRGHAAQPRRVGPALGRLAVARRQPHRPSRQEPSALDLRRREEDADEGGRFGGRRIRRPELVSRLEVAGVRGARAQPADADLPLRDRDGAHRAGDVGSVTTAAARRGARTASGSTSCRTATSSRSSAAPGALASPSRSGIGRRRSTTWP